MKSSVFFPDLTQARSGMAESSAKVLRNTYALLSVTLFFSALMAGLSLIMDWRIHPLLSFVVTLGLLLGIQGTARSAWGLFMVFVFTGWFGLSMGGTLSYYLESVPNGASVIVTAMAGTGIIFLGLSGYALTSKRDFSFMGGMLFAGMIVGLIAVIANLFLQMPALSVALSAVFILLFSGYILFATSRIIHGHETNYILATVDLYLSIINIFMSLLQLLGIFSNE